jgi:hypothetical protein
MASNGVRSSHAISIIRSMSCKLNCIVSTTTKNGMCFNRIGN